MDIFFFERWKKRKGHEQRLNNALFVCSVCCFIEKMVISKNQKLHFKIPILYLSIIFFEKLKLDPWFESCRGSGFKFTGKNKSLLTFQQTKQMNGINQNKIVLKLIIVYKIIICMYVWAGVFVKSKLFFLLFNEKKKNLHPFFFQ